MSFQIAKEFLKTRRGGQLTDEQYEILLRVHDKVVWPPEPEGCWMWIAAATEGYGILRYKNKDYRIHKFMFETFIGEVPEGLVLDHKCDNTLCINPFHTRPETNAVNILRGNGMGAQNARKEFCIRGHELAGSNLLPDPENKGYRRCRKCKQERGAAYNKQNREKNRLYMQERRARGLS